MYGNLDLRDAVKKYQMKADYSYVKVSLLKKVDEISELVEKDKEKWIIFVGTVQM